MISPAGNFRIYLAAEPVDFRKGMDGLAAIVQSEFDLDPFSGAIFVFRAKRADRLKLVVWDGTGLVLVYKRIEGAGFVWPRTRDGVSVASDPYF
ncbi:IS66 family insertion sequence element accessory protein TnpB [Paracoccus alkanivorans]|uniref:Transposase n=1 Tax=Paracoccus alkanivorans TaxID=2116655 RepID=A0A3M0MFW6_9RHOB|nr:transposase [Paracoccus alkanivorans]